MQIVKNRRTDPAPWATTTPQGAHVPAMTASFNAATESHPSSRLLRTGKVHKPSIEWPLASYRSFEFLTDMPCDRASEACTTPVGTATIFFVKTGTEHLGHVASPYPCIPWPDPRRAFRRRARILSARLPALWGPGPSLLFRCLEQTTARNCTTRCGELTWGYVDRVEPSHNLPIRPRIRPATIGKAVSCCTIAGQWI
jgi:hypothetical protein